jgi:hypothetical protein
MGVSRATCASALLLSVHARRDSRTMSRMTPGDNWRQYIRCMVRASPLVVPAHEGAFALIARAGGSTSAAAGARAGVPPAILAVHSASAADLRTRRTHSGRRHARRRRRPTSQTRTRPRAHRRPSRAARPARAAARARARTTGAGAPARAGAHLHTRRHPARAATRPRAGARVRATARGDRVAAFSRPRIAPRVAITHAHGVRAGVVAAPCFAAAGPRVSTSPRPERA